MTEPQRTEACESQERSGMDLFKKLVRSGSHTKDMSDEKLENWYDALRLNRMKQVAQAKRRDALVFVIVMMVFGGIIYGFYFIGLLYSGIILLGGSLLATLAIIRDSKIQTGGNWVSWMYVPFVILAFIVGLILTALGWGS